MRRGYIGAMSDSFESVLTVDVYYDGPNYRGLPHRFRSFGWLPDGEWSEGFDSDDDRFFLAPLDAPSDYPELIVHGEFRVRQPAPDLPPGVLRPLEVLWTVSGDSK